MEEIIVSERSGLELMQVLSARHADDAATQRLITELTLKAVFRISKLGELKYYKDTNGDINGDKNGDTRA